MAVEPRATSASHGGVTCAGAPGIALTTVRHRRYEAVVRRKQRRSHQRAAAEKAASGDKTCDDGDGGGDRCWAEPEVPRAVIGRQAEVVTGELVDRSHIRVARYQPITLGRGAGQSVQSNP